MQSTRNLVNIPINHKEELNAIFISIFFLFQFWKAPPLKIVRTPPPVKNCPYHPPPLEAASSIIFQICTFGSTNKLNSILDVWHVRVMMIILPFCCTKTICSWFPQLKYLDNISLWMVTYMKYFSQFDLWCAVKLICNLVISTFLYHILLK